MQLNINTKQKPSPKKSPSPVQGLVLDSKLQYTYQGINLELFRAIQLVTCALLGIRTSRFSKAFFALYRTILWVPLS